MPASALHTLGPRRHPTAPTCSRSCLQSWRRIATAGRRQAGCRPLLAILARPAESWLPQTATAPTAQAPLPLTSVQMASSGSPAAE